MLNTKQWKDLAILKLEKSSNRHLKLVRQGGSCSHEMDLCLSDKNSCTFENKVVKAVLAKLSLPNLSWFYFLSVSFHVF